MPTVSRGPLSVEYLDEGEGPAVVLAHSSVSGNRQWRRLIGHLRQRYRCLAPNLLGYGGTTAWTGPRRQTIDDAAQALLAVCDIAGAPLRLVGHSWGGYVALAAASRLGDRVSHLALYEPMMAGILHGHGRAEAWAEASALYADVRRLGDAGQWEELARVFTDYFNGDGAWAATDPERRSSVAAQLPPDRHEWDAGSQSITAEAFAQVTAQALLLCGTRTRRVLRETAEILHTAYPHWRYIDIPDAGHMGPLTHADAVNAEIAAFLDR